MPNLKQLALLCHKLEKALHAGFDIERALLIVQDDEPGSMRSALKRTYQGVSCGKPLSQAMRPDEALYTPELVNTVYVTEQTGHIELAFSRMAERFDLRESTKRKIRQAMLYPVIVLVVGIIALWVVAAVHHFLPTAFVITAAIAISLILTVTLGKGGKAMSNQSFLFGGFLIHLPYFGKLLLQEELADFAGNMAVFYSCGCNMEESLKFCARSMRSAALCDKVLKAADIVGKGIPLSDALQAQDIFPLDLLTSLRTGEASGNVDGMLLIIENYYRSDIRHRTEMLTTILRQ